MGQDGIGWNRMAWDRTEWDGIKREGMGWNRMSWGGRVVPGCLFKYLSIKM